jgi:hypothetical protein
MKRVAFFLTTFLACLPLTMAVAFVDWAEGFWNLVGYSLVGGGAVLAHELDEMFSRRRRP